MKKREFDCVVVANGKFPTAPQVLEYLKDAPYVIACDGALSKLLHHDLTPDAIVGDLDSLSSELKRIWEERIFHDADQETNDLTKSMKFAREKGFEKILILAATGLREDHMLGNISLLLTYRDWFDEVVMMSDYGYFVPITTTTVFDSFEGQQISLFSLYPHGELSTEGLLYPICQRQLHAWWEGTLNESTGNKFIIRLDGENNVIVYFKWGK